MKKRSNFQIMGRLVGLVKPLIGFMILAIVMGVIGFLAAISITVFGGYAMLDVLQMSTPITLKTAVVCVIVFALVRGFLRYAEQACNHFIAFKLLALIRDKVFQALRRLCPAKLEGKDKGNLISVITSDIELLEVFYAHTISPIAIAICMAVIMTIWISCYHWLLGLIALVAYLVIGAVIPIVISKKTGDSGMVFRSKSGELSSYVLDSLRGLKESIQYSTGEQRLEQLNQHTDQLSKEEAKMKRRTGQNMAITNTAILVFDLIMLLVAALLYHNQMIAFDGVLIPVVAMMSSFGPVVALANLGSTLQNTFAAGNRVLDILDESPAVEEITGKQEINFQGAEVKQVTFSYGNEMILSNLNLQIPQHQVTGIVGKSGSGKSTLLKLMMRFWKVQQGEIAISGKQIDQINTTNLREMESFVTQETHLFHDSIENNIRIAKLDATQEEIVAACKKASIHEFIMSLPNGYQTNVGELGDTLSGGEKQRIGLARAFLHDAPLILLDEPTSNLDSLNEAVILKSLHEERQDKTVVLVSHRESTMGIANKVYSVEHGRMS
ncbi:thiol reductant ABC exporter subunit CydC [Massilioclostridium coli]|uniref:thiol reductant ABC exporter subunit CydC n=1 Tax=Massilioclostridium coli TaxID=1870991 RepID=UPI00085C4370|nr:thiol reductant ABC exporter subunit CydC [Massilioclostridium coli]